MTLHDPVPMWLATGKAVDDSTNGLVLRPVSLKGAWVKGVAFLLAGEAISVGDAGPATMT
jgi:hypothetical protein